MGLGHGGQVIQVDVQVIGEHWLISQESALASLPGSREGKDGEDMV
jgi:hypothetical protein